MIYQCCDDRRRDALLGHPTLNGLDNVEVLDDPGLPMDERQRRLRVRLVNPALTPAAEQFHVDGGVRITTIGVLAVDAEPADADGEQRAFLLTLDRPGDFSRYTLRLVGADGDAPPPGFDPVLSGIDFFFKAGCQSDIDCEARGTCPPAPYPEIGRAHV